jgi:hypothetical protein
MVLMLAAALPLLAACDTTVSPERAYEQCSERARLAERPRGRIAMGVGSGGPAGDLDLTVSSDFLTGRDPYVVYDTCFRNLTGAGPTRPLIL